MNRNVGIHGQPQAGGAIDTANLDAASGSPQFGLQLDWSPLGHPLGRDHQPTGLDPQFGERRNPQQGLPQGIPQALPAGPRQRTAETFAREAHLAVDLKWVIQPQALAPQHLAHLHLNRLTAQIHLLDLQPGIGGAPGHHLHPRQPTAQQGQGRTLQPNLQALDALALLAQP